MDTLHEPSDISADRETATPYFLRRRRAFNGAVGEIERWYAGGLPPDPLAA